MRIRGRLGMGMVLGILLWGLRSSISAQTEDESQAQNPEPLSPRLVSRLGSDRFDVGGRRRSSAKAEHAAVGHDRPASKLTFSPDGRLLATASRDHSVCVWEIKTGQLLNKFQAQFDLVHGDLRFSPDGWLLGVSGQQGNYRLWEVSSGELLVEKGHIQNLSTASESRFSPELDRLAVGSRKGKVHMVETSTGTSHAVLDVFDEHRTGALAFSGDGRFLAVGAYRSRSPMTPRGSVSLWDLQKEKKLRELKSPEPENQRAGSVRYEALEFSPDGGTLAARHSELGLEFWRPFEGTRIARIPHRASRPMAFSPMGRVLVLLSAPGIRNRQSSFSQLDLMEPATGGIFQSWKMPKQAKAFALSPDGRRLALSSVQSRRILLYELAPPSSERLPPQKDLEKAVKELTERDAVKGRKAMATLIAAGEPSVPLLADDLKGDNKPGGREKTIQRLIGDLDDDDFFVREKAMKRLADFGPIATPALKDASENEPSTEAAYRIRALLKYAKTAGTIPSESLRRIRSLEILERIGTAEARELLQSLAKGPDDSHQARLARRVLKRIQKSAPKP